MRGRKVKSPDAPDLKHQIILSHWCARCCQVVKNPRPFRAWITNGAHPTHQVTAAGAQSAQRFAASLIVMLETFQSAPCFLLTSVMIWPALFSVTVRLP